jgi:hypothetical protein
MRGFVMWQPSERVFTKYHLAGSVAALVFGLSVVAIFFAPSHFPGVHRLLVDDRVGIVIPYLLFLVIGESIFSIWYFLFRK